MSIADKLNTLQTIKENIKTAIENKGVTVGDVPFTDYSEKINNIKISGSLNVQETGIILSDSKFTTVPDGLDWDGITSMRFMFSNCKYLTELPLIDTSKVTNMDLMLQNCTSLTTIPSLDTSKVESLSLMFNGCSNLTTIPQLDGSSISESYGPFSYSSNLINVGGFTNLKYGFHYGDGFNKLENLTYQSCINILNGLFDFVGNGEEPKTAQGVIKVHKNFLDAVGDEVSIATNKGWTITA